MSPATGAWITAALAAGGGRATRTIQAVSGGDTGTAIVTVAGAAMLAVLSVRLLVLSVRIRRSAARDRFAVWEYYGYAGAMGAAYGGLLLTGAVLDRPLPFLDGLLLAFATLIAFALREAYFSETLSNAERDRLGEFRSRRTFEVGVVLVVVAVTVGPLLRRGAAVVVLTAVAATLVVGYGLVYQLRRGTNDRTRGTLLDTLVRQSVPVLVFAGGALVAPALAVGPPSTAVAESVAAVFLVATATSLMTVTIKLRQHLGATG